MSRDDVVDNPCVKDCPERSATCHADCEKYARFAAWCERRREGTGGGKGAERGSHARHEARYGNQTVQAEARQEVKNSPRSDPGALFLCPLILAGII